MVTEVVEMWRVADETAVVDGSVGAEDEDVSGDVDEREEVAVYAGEMVDVEGSGVDEDDDLAEEPVWVVMRGVVSMDASADDVGWEESALVSEGDEVCGVVDDSVVVDAVVAAVDAGAWVVDGVLPCVDEIFVLFVVPSEARSAEQATMTHREHNTRKDESKCGESGEERENNFTIKRVRF